MRNDVTQYDKILHDISKITTVQQAKKIINQAEAMRVYAKQAKDPKLLDKAIEVKFGAQIRAGELLIDLDKRGERAKGGKKNLRPGSHAATPENQPKLSDLGVTKTESSRWQKLATMPKPQQTDRLRLAQRKARAAIDAVAKQLRVELRAADEERIKALVPIKGKFKTVVVDPPWDYEWLSIAGRAKPGYATMRHDELMNMKVQNWAEENAHMYLWVTNNFLTRGVELMEQWGFKHKTVLTWNKLSKTGKPWFGLGSYFRNATEHVLFGVRGELRTRVSNIPTIFPAKIRDHSEKPDEFYTIVRKASFTPAIEFFQRQPRDGFVNAFETPMPALDAAE